ncbi:hypothetical protein C0Q70_12899 [Pomacea canaliculata]|uniref:Uncharacterized protein n=1 Tax=Pomacea canaliculata TaxID=400727 RepID=A0A2T7P2S1_POMCA|nr:hypothetical protein C0Q70_12899 [Pomacea canaliculata]
MAPPLAFLLALKGDSIQLGRGENSGQRPGEARLKTTGTQNKQDVTKCFLPDQSQQHGVASVS